MTGDTTRPDRRRRAPARGGLFLLALAVTILGLAAAQGTAAATGGPAWTAATTSWTNGLVLCTFGEASPGATVSAAGLGDTGLTTNLQEVDEVAPGGTIVEFALSASGVWTSWNASTPDEFDFAYNASIPIETTSAHRSTVGLANVSVQYLLPAYGNPGAPDLTQVVTQFSVSNWSWAGAGDHLVLVVPLGVAYPSTERFGTVDSAAASVTTYSTSTGDPLGDFVPGPVAWANRTGSAPIPVPVVPAFNVTAAGGEVQLIVGNGSQGLFTSVNYSDRVGVMLPPTLAVIPPYAYAIVGLASAGTVAAFAIVLRWARRQDPVLMYTEEP